MHRRALAIVTMAVACTIAALPVGAQRATYDRILHTQTLDNGMQVIVVENHSVPVATAEIVFRAGAMTQEDEDQGVPHLFEHMLFKSYRGDGGAPFGWEAAQQHAGYNGATSDEAVMYYLTLPSANTDRALGILARLVRDARFENEDFQPERFVVLGELQRAGSNPQFHLDREASTLLWGTSFARKNVIGDELPLLQVNTSRLKTIFERYYVPNNAALIVSGDVSAPRVFEMARSHFAGWKRRPDPFAGHPVPPMAVLGSSRAVVVTGDVNTVTLELEWQGPSVSDDPRGTYAADVLSDVLQDDQSDFHTRLVDSGLFQSADLVYTTRAHVGRSPFTV